MTDAERDALIKVRNGLASGEYVHSRDNPQTGKRGFDMNEYRNPCRTGACIGGWMANELGIQPVGYVHGGGFDSDLMQLFFPDDRFDYESITVHQAVQAIDNFLACGNPKWEEILDD